MFSTAHVPSECSCWRLKVALKRAREHRLWEPWGIHHQGLKFCSCWVSSASFNLVRCERCCGEFMMGRRRVGVVRMRTIGLWARGCMKMKKLKRTLTATWGTVGRQGRGSSGVWKQLTKELGEAVDVMSNLLKNRFNSLAISYISSVPPALTDLKLVMVFIRFQTSLMLFCWSFHSSFLL